MEEEESEPTPSSQEEELAVTPARKKVGLETYHIVLLSCKGNL